MPIPVLPFTEAIAWFRARVPMSDDEYAALQGQAKHKAFALAGVAQVSLAADVWRSLERHMSDGPDVPAFVAEFAPKLAALWGVTEGKAGARLRLVAQNALQSSYNAGRWAQATRGLAPKLFPYLQFIAIRDDRTTTICRALDGTILPVDDPRWQRRAPPCHHGCRSTVSSKRAKWVDEQGGPTEGPIDATADEGWGLVPAPDEWVAPVPADLPAPLAKALAAKPAPPPWVPTPAPEAPPVPSPVAPPPPVGAPVVAPVVGPAEPPPPLEPPPLPPPAPAAAPPELDDAGKPLWRPPPRDVDPSPQAPPGDRLPGARYTAPRLPGSPVLPGQAIDLDALPTVNLKTLFPEGAHDYAAGERGRLPSGEDEAAWRKRHREATRGVWSTEHVDAIRKFTSADYTPIRLHEAGASPADAATWGLRPAKMAEAARLSATITEALAAAAPEPGTVFRGLAQVAEKDLAALLAQPPGFGLGVKGVGGTASATWSRRVAHSFADAAKAKPGHWNVVFVIRGRTQVAVAHVSVLPEEQELIFSREARFRVVSVARHDGDDSPHVPGYADAHGERRARVLVVELDELP